MCRLLFIHFIQYLSTASYHITSHQYRLVVRDLVCYWLVFFFFLFNVQWTVRDVTTGKPNEGEKEWCWTWWGSGYTKSTQNRQPFCCWTCIKWYYRYHVMSVDAKQSKGRWIVGVDERNQPWMMPWERRMKKREERRRMKRKKRIEEVSWGKVSHDISLEMRVISYSCGLWYFEHQQKNRNHNNNQKVLHAYQSQVQIDSVRRHDGSTFWWWSYSSLFSSYKSNTKSLTASLISTPGLVHD